VKLPAGYAISYGGQFENQQRAMRRLLLVIPLALAIVCGLLYMTFHSIRHAMLILVKRAIRTGGWNCRSMDIQPQSESLRIGRLHRSLGGRGTERCSARQLHQPIERRGRIAPPCRPARIRPPFAAGTHDSTCRQSRIRSHGDFHFNWSRGAAASGDSCDWRPHQFQLC